VKTRLLVIGFGMAAQRFLEELLPLKGEAFDVTVCGAEAEPAYDRVRLSSALALGSELGALQLKPQPWYEEHEVRQVLGDSVARLDLGAKQAHTASGQVLGFDHVVLATGSQPLLPPLPGLQLPGVQVFRRLADVQALRQAARPGVRAVVVGGGLLGLEAAYGLSLLGASVTVLHLAERLMERQLDAQAAAYLQRDLEAKGIHFELGAETVALEGGERLNAVKLKDGRVLAADLAVLAIGIRPETALAREAGLQVKRGIVVDDELATSHAGAWALGECAEHRGVCYGLVAPLYEQAATLAKRLAGMERAPYAGSSVYAKLKVAGLEVFSAGDFMGGPQSRQLVVEDGTRGLYKKAVFEGPRLVGAVLVGDASASTRLLAAMKKEDGQQEAREALGLGGTAATSPLQGLSEHELLCQCNQVTLGAVKQAVRSQGLRSVTAVRACTTASSSCGSCTSLVEAVLRQENSAPSPVLPVPAAPVAGIQAGGLAMAGAKS